MLSVFQLQEPQGRTVMDIVRLVRGRWRMRLALRGLAIFIGASMALMLLATFGMDAFKFSPGAVTAFRTGTYVLLPVVAIWFLIRPLLRRVSDRQVALYIEEHEPSLQAALLSAVEVDTGKEGRELSPELTRRLVETAIEKCRGMEYGRQIEQRGIYQSTGTLAGIVAASAVALLISPNFWRNGAPFLFSPWGGGAGDNPYAVAVAPGDTLLAKGADQLISAQLVGFDAELVEVVVKRGDGEWERWGMTPGAGAGEYEIFLFDLQEATDYYVETSGLRSDLFHITVAELPYVQQIDLEYRFPAYSGLSPRVEEDGGDIAALRGTRVVVSIQPTIAVQGGRILVDGEEPLDLTVGEDGKLQATITVQRQGYYRVELMSVNDRLVPASPDYAIDALDDQPPTISITKPGRDTKVTSVDEPFIEISAEDDYGIGRMDLVYSVNGAAEDTVVLYDGSRNADEMTAGHTFYLEELDLEPGDLISYYATVRDNNRGSRAQRATTDIYFMDVRPFRRDYREADQGGGGGGGGGGGEMDGSLSVQQREIVAATFKMIRDRDEFDDEDYEENLTTLALAQGRIRERVDAIIRRLGERAAVQRDSGFRAIAEELPKASAAMEIAEEKLGERDPDEAMPPAQTALQHLQRADAAFRDMQVSRQQQGGGGGGGGQQPNAEDLADLFELELDKLRNQYESVQRGQQQQVDEEVDEALQRLRELARRQQQENERARQRAQQQQQGAAGGGGRAQRQLADETEELARQLQRLWREQSLPQLEETARRLQEAADAMRRNAAAGRSGATAQGREALDQLREARRLLDQNQSARLERDVDDALRRADRLAEEQEEIADAVRSLPDGGARRTENLRRLVERKDAMVEEINDLEARLDRMARESRGEQREASQELAGAATSIRDNRLPEKVRYSRGVMQQRSRDYASNFEEQIGDNIDELRERISAASNAIGESPEQQLGRSLDDTRDLVRGLESLRDRVESTAEQNARGDAEQRRLGERPGEQQSGEEGQQGQGQQGQGQQGQGQEGQQGEGGQQGGGQQQGDGARGGQESAVGGGNGFAPGTRSLGAGRLTRDDIRQFRREVTERRGDAQRLQQQLRAQGVDTERIGEILRNLQALERERIYNDPEEVLRLQAAVIEGLKEFEYSLRRQVEGDDERRAFLAGSDEVPRGFRTMVEEYYRELSKGKDEGR